MSYGNYVGPRNTNPQRVPQSAPLPGENQVRNSAGGYVYQISDIERFRRFLILGSDAGSYYATDRKLTSENAENIMQVIEKYGNAAIDIIVEISHSGRAPKNNPALFALAIATGTKTESVRKYALANLFRVARTATHLFDFLNYVREFRGWGRALKHTVADWYNKKPVDSLAYQVVKYRQRNGWTHRDVLRQAHPNPVDDGHRDLFHWIVDQNPDVENKTVRDFMLVQNEKCDLDTVLRILREGVLPWEALPTHLLNEVAVWEALLPTMPTTAMLRNLGKMSSIGVFNKKANVQIVNSVFTDIERLHKDRIHPVNLYVALKTYESGHGVRGSLSWVPSGTVVSALNTGFDLAYKGLPRIKGRVLIALDVSGSMSSSTYNGVISARELSVATARALMTQMDEYVICMFSSGTGRHSDWGAGMRTRGVNTSTFSGFQKLEVPFDARVTDLVRASEMYSGMYSRTDCAIPARWATANSEVFDAIITITDNETWAGDVHPVQALRTYRETIGRPVKNIVLGVTATDFSIADPSDPNSLDLVGFDSNVPNMIGDFISGSATTFENEIDE